MPTRLASDSPHRRFAENIVRQIVEQHHIAYFAGGCVRDDLLGIPPSDYDVATSATPEQVRSIFGAHRTLFVGAAFGVVCVHQRIDGVLYQVEVATFRSDGDYSDGRRPDRVDYTTPAHDAQRRDFTLNGLFFDPLANKVIDFVNGQKDLERRLLRAIGDPHDRFREDKLRLLRAVRIAARFGFEIEERTQCAISEMASEIGVVSPERIAAEMRKMLEHPHRAAAVELLEQFGLLREVFPDVAEPLAQPNFRTKTLSRLGSLEAQDFVAALAILCFASIEWREVKESNPVATLDESFEFIRDASDVKTIVSELKTLWRLSNDDAAALEFTLASADVFFAADRAKWSVLQPLLVSPYIKTALHFASTILRSDQGHDTPLDRCREAMKLPRLELNPEPLVDGQLLMSLGLPTGPMYARLIKLGRSAQLDGELHNRDDAADWVRQQNQ